MPQSLHAELARAAEREEVSLNQFITSSLASAVSWRGGGVESTSGDGPAAQKGRGLRTALMANIVLLVLIAVLAILLLVVALTRG
jgi:hypothetical protein